MLFWLVWYVEIIYVRIRLTVSPKFLFSYYHQLPHTELHCYQLSTAENELGVVVAMAAESGLHGVPMIPVSWTEMQCPQSLVKEPRKVAKIVSESAVNIKAEPKT